MRASRMGVRSADRDIGCGFMIRFDEDEAEILAHHLPLGVLQQDLEPAPKLRDQPPNQPHRVILLIELMYIQPRYSHVEWSDL